jgi:hypothetical protein
MSMVATNTGLPSFFVVAISSTNGANKAGTPLSSLYYLDVYGQKCWILLSFVIVVSVCTHPGNTN